MTLREFIKILLSDECSLDYEVYVASPDDSEDYFVDRVAISDKKKTVTLRTSC